MADTTDKPRFARGKNPASLKNLRPFKKGEASGNPEGRPPKPVCVTSWLKEYADHKISEQIDPKTLTFAQAAALSAWKEAAKGDLSQYNFIIDRIEGKVTLPIGGINGNPIEVNIGYKDKILNAVSRYATRGGETPNIKES